MRVRSGAVAAVIYAAESAPDPFIMSVGTATLPAEMVSYSDGLAMKAATASGTVRAVLRFTIGPVPVDPLRMASFSSTGPGVDASIKPDLVAVGDDMYTATQTFDRTGDMYDPSGYVTVGGTSFSAPFTAGVAALLKSARPGLSVDQYRSLILNTASTLPNTRLMQSGAGLLNAFAALHATATAAPAKLDFGSGGSSIDTVRKLKITNTSGSDEIYSITFDGAGSAPSVASNTVSLPAGGSTEIDLVWQASGLEPGSHEGFARISGATSGTELRVPYWYAVRNGVPAAITVISTTASGRRGGMLRDAVFFKVLDAAGLPLLDVPIQIESVTGGGAALSLTSYDGEVPGLYSATLRLGIAAGTNDFRLHAGDAWVDFSITGR